MTFDEITQNVLGSTRATEYIAVALLLQFAAIRQAHKSYLTIYCSSEVTKEKGNFTLHVGSIKTNKVKLHVHKTSARDEAE